MQRYDNVLWRRPRQHLFANFVTRKSSSVTELCDVIKINRVAEKGEIYINTFSTNLGICASIVVAYFVLQLDQSCPVFHRL